MLSVTKLFRYKTFVTKERYKRERKERERVLQKSVTKDRYKTLSILYSILFPNHLFTCVLVNVAVAKPVFR